MPSFSTCAEAAGSRPASVWLELENELHHPDAMIWDTGALGKPDVLQLAYGAYARSGAEAVICVSNSTVTRQVVHGLEQRGIPAFGPIWDS